MLGFIIGVIIVDVLILAFVPGEKIQKAQDWVLKQINKLKS